MKNGYIIIIIILLSIISLLIGVYDLGLGGIQLLALSRFPRLMATIIAGMSMSVSGLIMQQLSRNKFVSPTTAATMDSAKLGILISLILFPAASSFTKMSLAFISALGGTFLFMGLLRRLKFKNVVFVPLIGIMLGKIIDSITTFFAYRFDLVQNISTWMMGNFSMIIKGRYELLYIAVPLLVVAMIYANKFTIAGMGEDFAANLGLKYHQVVNIGLALVALNAATVIVTVGQIPFVGLIIPNIVTIYRGDNLRNNILTTALFGAAFLLATDIISRVIIYPYEIPIGLTVGVIGSLIFLYLLFRRNES